MGVKSIIIFVPGIMEWPGDWKKWCYRFTTWFNIHTELKTEPKPYYATVFTLRSRNALRGASLAKTFQHYLSNHWKVYVVCHSNGAQVVNQAIGWIPLSVLHVNPIKGIFMYSAALSWRDSNIKQALVDDGIDRAVFFNAGRDKMLFFARFTKRFGSAGIRDDAVLKEDVPEKVMIIREKYHGHSDWFKKRNWVGEAKHICELVGIKYDSS